MTHQDQTEIIVKRVYLSEESDFQDYATDIISRSTDSTDMVWMTLIEQFAGILNQAGYYIDVDNLMEHIEEAAYTQIVKLTTQDQNF